MLPLAFIAGIGLGTVFIILFMRAARRADERREDSAGLGMKRCPRCALEQPNEADVCRGCGFEFLPDWVERKPPARTQEQIASDMEMDRQAAREGLNPHR
jgi:hypothetical protein